MTWFGRFALGGQGHREANSETGLYGRLSVLSMSPWEGRDEYTISLQSQKFIWTGLAGIGYGDTHNQYRCISSAYCPGAIWLNRTVCVGIVGTIWNGF